MQKTSKAPKGYTRREKTNTTCGVFLYTVSCNKHHYTHFTTQRAQKLYSILQQSFKYAAQTKNSSTLAHQKEKKGMAANENDG